VGIFVLSLTTFKISPKVIKVFNYFQISKKIVKEAHLILNTSRILTKLNKPEQHSSVGWALTFSQ
jgi:hypothetical protein